MVSIGAINESLLEDRARNKERWVKGTSTSEWKRQDQ